MSTPAVTPAAPAVASETTEEVSLQERLNAATPEEYKTWERTGDIPPVKPKSDATPPNSETPAASTESSAVPSGENTPPLATESAAASEAARPAQKKRNADSRITQLLEERKKEREEWDARYKSLEEKLTKPAAPSGTAASQPATETSKTETKRARPKLADNDPKTGKPFSSLDAWQDAVDEWHDERVNGKLDERLSKSDQQRAQAEQQRVKDEALAIKFQPVRAKYADFDKVALNPDLFVPLGSPVDEFIRNSEHGAEILYHLGQNPELLSRFYRETTKQGDKGRSFEQLVHPSLQYVELAKIEARLTSSPVTTPPAAAVTTPSVPARQPLPPPPTVLSARSSAATDATEEALHKKSFADYEKAENARERKARRA